MADIAVVIDTPFAVYVLSTEYLSIQSSWSLCPTSVLQRWKHNRGPICLTQRWAQSLLYKRATTDLVAPKIEASESDRLSSQGQSQLRLLVRYGLEGLFGGNEM